MTLLGFNQALWVVRHRLELSWRNNHTNYKAISLFRYQMQHLSLASYSAFRIQTQSFHTTCHPRKISTCCRLFLCELFGNSFQPSVIARARSKLFLIVRLQRNHCETYWKSATAFVSTHHTNVTTLSLYSCCLRVCHYQTLQQILLNFVMTRLHAKRVHANSTKIF